MKKFLFLLLSILLILPLIIAVPPVLSTTQPTSLEIIAPTFEYLPQNTKLDFYWHVFNASQLLTNTTTSCNFHLYSENKGGEHIFLNSNVKMFSNLRDFEAEVPAQNFSTIGSYCSLIECNTSSQSGGLERCFEVTFNGKPEPDGVLTAFFVIFFLIIVGLTCYLVLYSIGHMVSADFDIIDLSLNWGLFFVLLAFYFLENYYLGNQAMDTYLLWLMSAGGILLILVPIIAFILSLVYGSFKQGGHTFRVPKRRL